MLEACASLKSFRRQDAGPSVPPDDPGNPTVNFHGEARKTDTHASAPPRRAAVSQGERQRSGDKNFAVSSFVAAMCALEITPHVARKSGSAIDNRTTRHAGYDVSQRKRKLVEQVFGWMKTQTFVASALLAVSAVQVFVTVLEYLRP